AKRRQREGIAVRKRCTQASRLGQEVCAPALALRGAANVPEGARALLGERHVHHFELQTVGTTEVKRVVAAGSERKLARSVEDFGAESAYELMQRIDLFVALDVERHVMQTRLIDFEGVACELRFSLPDVEGRAIRVVDVDRQIVIGTLVVKDGAHRVAEKL